MNNIAHTNNNPIYYNGIYWNNYELIQQYLNLLSTGSKDIFWADWLASKYQDHNFNRALVPNCGDGHIERMFIDKKIIKEAVGTDWSDDLLNQACDTASKLNFKIDYHKVDTNTADFPDYQYDMVVNHAACHHIQYIYKVFYKFYNLLKETNGLFINYDYVGPHRNQYTANQWEKVYQCNLELPEFARQNLLKTYAHIPTMLVTDHTEAIHSELVKKAFSIFFDTITYRPLGGPIAYPILTHNDNFAKIENKNEQNQLIEQIIIADKKYMREYPGSELFAFFIGKPKKHLSNNICKILEEEIKRELHAQNNHGYYYNTTCVAFLYQEIDRLNNQIKA